MTTKKQTIVTIDGNSNPAPDVESNAKSKSKSKRKISKDSTFFQGRILVKKKLSDGDYGTYCICGAKLKLSAKVLLNDKHDLLPCNCGTDPLPGALVVLDGADAGPVTDAAKMEKLKGRLAKLDSTFKEDVGSIQSLLHGHNAEGAISKFQKQALSTLIELIPIAEEKYRLYGNERSAYALGALISQCRELVGDIKAEHDSQGLALRLAHNIIQPAFISIMQNMVDNMYGLKRGLEMYIPDSRLRDAHNQIDMSAREITHFLEQSYNHIRDRIVAEMTEN